MDQEQAVLNKLREQAGDKIKVGNEYFLNTDEMEKANEKDLAELGEVASGVSPGYDVPPRTIEERLEDIGMSKDNAIDMIMELSDTGYIKDKVSLFGGKFTGVFRTAKITDTKAFVDLFDAMEINTQAKGEYYLNLYALASILIEFNGESLEIDDVISRARWIENNLPVPIYKTLISKANKFHEKIEILNSDEVADFF